MLETYCIICFELIITRSLGGAEGLFFSQNISITMRVDLGIPRKTRDLAPIPRITVVSRLRALYMLDLVILTNQMCQCWNDVAPSICIEFIMKPRGYRTACFVVKHGWCVSMSPNAWRYQHGVALPPSILNWECNASCRPYLHRANTMPVPSKKIAAVQ